MWLEKGKKKIVEFSRTIIQILLDKKPIIYKGSAL